MNVPFKNKTSLAMPGISATRLTIPLHNTGSSYWTPQSVSGLDTWYQGVSEEDVLIPVLGVVGSDANIYFRWDTSIKGEYAIDNKVFAYSNGVLYLSYDAGFSFVKNIPFADCNEIRRSKIYANGNILWCTQTKVYLSTDDLSTYNEVIVKDIDGSAWTPSVNSDGQSYKELNVGRQVIIGGVEYDVWGNYGNSVGVSDNETNVFATLDSGVTIRIIYKFDGIAPNLAARHIHATNFIDGYWIVQTGDTVDRCNWLKLTYSGGVWTPLTLASSDENSYNKTTGMYYDGTYIFWGSDATGDVLKRSIYKVPIAGLLDTVEYIGVYSNVADIINSFQMNSNGEFIAGCGGNSYRKLILSKDSGVTNLEKTLTGPGGNLSYLRVSTKNAQGWWRMDASISTLPFGTGTMWVKFK